MAWRMTSGSCSSVNITIGRGWSRLTSTTCSITSRPGDSVSIRITSGRTVSTRAGRSMVRPDSSITSNPASVSAALRRPTLRGVSLINRIRNILVLLSAQGVAAGVVGQGMQAEAAGVGGRVGAIPDLAVDQLAAAHVLGVCGDADGIGRLAIQVQLLHLAGNAQVVRVFAQQAPAAKLGHEPHAVGEVGQVHLAIGEKAQRMGILPLVAETILVGPEQTRFDAVERCVEVLAGGVGVLVDERLGAAEHFFRMVRPDRLGGRQGEALVLLHRAGAPGFADTKTVNAPG